MKIYFSWGTSFLNFSDTFFIPPAMACCQLPLEQISGLLCLYSFNYQRVMSMMSLEIKYRLLG
ncbi:MAG: hypothetical protein DRH34_11200 [Deltaproteobacteria bacterium]|nr:MAG: hypothetical protein DRH34_11200 [Deltaproteobacteria bacterium]